MSWEDRTVLVVGAARQGIALARFLAESGAEVILNDRAPLEDLVQARKSLADLTIRWAGGGHSLELLEGVDLVCPSGGVPLSLPILVEAAKRKIPFSNDSQIFLEEVPCMVIGITGSAGKTTTTALVGQIAAIASQQASRDELPGEQNYPRTVWVGGNIGNPLISDVREMKADDLVVMELSSFQLELMDRSPGIATVLNITPNHLDRHGTMKAYTDAKSRILRFQDTRSWAILREDDTGSWGLRSEVQGNLMVFCEHEPDNHIPAVFVREDQIHLRDIAEDLSMMPVSAIKLRGKHNLFNVLAACAIAYAAGLPVDNIRMGVEGFLGLPHRLEFVRHWRGADWYNDSIATAPERAIAAIRSFEAPLILLVGGRDKDLPWEAFADEVHRRVDHLIVFGEAAPIILRAVRASNSGPKPISVSRCKDLQEAVIIAEQLSEPGDVVLLAPGGTSFDEFRDFEERGDWYKKWVNALS